MVLVRSARVMLHISSRGDDSLVRTSKEACCFLLAVLRIDRPHCVDHPARRQVKPPAAHQLCECALLQPQQSEHISGHEQVS